MADPTRGITCPDMRRVVREALRQGWEWAGFTGTTHCRIVWPATGQAVGFGTTPSHGSWKHTAADIKRISGVVVHRKGNHKRSHKACKPSGFKLGGTTYLDAKLHETVDPLYAERDRLINECRELAADRAQLRLIPDKLARIQAIEAELRRYAQPVEPFDPYTLAR